MAICPYCGSQIGDKAEICGFCGGKLTLDFTAPPEEISRVIPEAETESEYEGIPDDILGSVLGSLGAGTVAAKRSPEVPAAEIPDIPTVEEILEAPAIEPLPEAPAAEIPEIPAVEEGIAVPAAEEAPAAPAAEEIPVIPAAEEVPVIPAAEQPAYAQPVFAQPAKTGKKNSWILPAVIVAALALIGILFFATRGGGGGSKAADPNLGLYKATVVEMYGMELSADDIYEQGFTIELKTGGVCEIKSLGETGKGKWTLEGEKITIDDSHSTITGTLSDGVLILEDMLDMDLNITMEKQES